MVNKIFTILLVIPAFASIMLFSTFMTPVSAGGPGPDFIGAPVTPFILNIDLSNAVQATSLKEGFEIREGFRAPTQPGWENHSAIETTASETNYKASEVQQLSMHAVDATFGTPTQNFEGIPFTGFRPPDTNGDIGPNHYIQMVNSQFQIFDRLGNPSAIRWDPDPERSSRSGGKGPHSLARAADNRSEGSEAEPGPLS